MMQPYEELEYILWNLLQRVLVGWLNTQLCHQRHFGTARHSHYLIRIAIISITGWAVLVPLMMHHRINAFQILRNRQLPPTNWCFKCAGPPSLLLFHPFPVTQLWFPISTSSPGHKCRGEPGNSKFAFSAVVVIVSPVFGECTSPRVCVESYGRGEGWPSFHFAQTHTVESIQLRCSSSSWAVPAALLCTPLLIPQCIPTALKYELQQPQRPLVFLPILPPVAIAARHSTPQWACLCGCV